ncbi:unnamed protein product [Caenorhabditis sp. 36 PRJEB53466]|nr:unnamed protein product [Caenorhabditis sp. 36 PRJEB53466]
MPVTAVGSLLELNNILERSDANRLIIVDFFAHWCGPCRIVSPAFEQMSAEFGNATFLKVNVDEARDIAARYAISAMPTFVFIKNGRQVESVRGANVSAIRAAIEKHYSSTPANPNSASDAEKRFLERFVSSANLKNYYTDEVFKALARSVVPEEELVRKATDQDGKVSEIELLRNLLEWFKTDFFSWFDKPTCEKCSLKAKTALSGTPTKAESDGGAARVEVYSCDGCDAEMRFPRYNDPAKLLQTRTGRCGEWANCFALILSAMGLECRYVYDTTDHVWNEVYLKDEHRWIHVDPCENTLDRPLLYTKGWKKRLTYCIAFGNDHVADVTWRYVYDAKRTNELRTEVRQKVLENFLAKLNARQMDGQSEERKKELAVRRTVELLEMMTADARNLKIGWEKLGDDFGGRTTGSEEWRRARGEMGSSATPAVLGAPIKLALEGGNYAEFGYDVNADTYSQEPAQGFRAAAFSSDNVMRKVEDDWNQVYLCRIDGEKPAEISWHFDLESLGKELEKVEIHVNGIAKFENGRAMAMACLGDTCNLISPKTGVLVLEHPTAGILKISANMSGGEGRNAFQHAQIFRTNRTTVPIESLVVKVWTK